MAWIREGKGFERRPLVLGATNDQFVEVKDGLVEGMDVVLNPRAVIPEARGVKEAAEEVDVDKKFGKERMRAPDAEKSPPGGPEKGGPAKGGPAGDGAGGPEQVDQERADQMVAVPGAR